MYTRVPPANRFDQRAPNPWARVAAYRPGFPLGEAPIAITQQMLHALQAEHAAKTNLVMQSIAKNVQDDMKKAVLKTAAIQTGVTLALNAIPVVGWAASAIVSVAAAIGGSKYQAEAESIMADAQNEVARMQAQSEVRINDMLIEVFNEETKPAIELAISGQGLQGLGALGFSIKKTFKRVTKEIKRGVDRVTDEFGRTFDNVEDFGRSIEKEADRFGERVQREVIDPMVGRTIKLEAREARDRIIREARSALQTHEANIKTLIATPEYRANLRLELARELQSNPMIQQMVADRQALERQIAQIQARAPAQAPGIAPTPGMPNQSAATKAASKAPLLIGAGAVLWALMS